MHHRLHDGQLVSFTGKHTSHDKFNKIGVAWEGGRREFGGPVESEPFPYTFRLARVIDNQGGSAADMAEARANAIAVGDTFHVEGLAGAWRVTEPGWSNAGIKFEQIEEV